jgi:hypothetical protein
VVKTLSPSSRGDGGDAGTPLLLHTLLTYSLFYVRIVQILQMSTKSVRIPTRQ